MTFNYNEDYVLATDENSNGIVVWDSRNGTFLKKILGNSDKLTCISASPVMDSFVTCSMDAKIKYWVAE
jgi:WD40 repeat protein